MDDRKLFLTVRRDRLAAHLGIILLIKMLLLVGLGFAFFRVRIHTTRITEW